MKRKTTISIALAALIAIPAGVLAYNYSGSRWPGSWPTPSWRFAAPTSDPTAGSESDQIAAVDSAAGAWRTQSNARFQFLYAGRTSSWTNSNDGVNQFTFAPFDGGSALARTYRWTSGSNLVDADIIFYGFTNGIPIHWQLANTYGWGGWNGTQYTYYNSSIRHVAMHEFGHALGLDHTPGTVMNADENGTYSLTTDDKAGVEYIYGACIPQCPGGSCGWQSDGCQGSIWCGTCPPSCGSIGGNYCSPTAGWCPQGYDNLGPTYDCPTCCRQGPSCGAIGGSYCSQSGGCPQGYNNLGTTYDCPTCCRQGPSCGAIGGSYCSQSGGCPTGLAPLGWTYDCSPCCG
jgi:hypothetical protein